MEKEKLINEIALLEEKHQQFLQGNIKNELDIAITKLKLFEANKTAKEIIWADQ